jgi:hypothetical protein
LKVYDFKTYEKNYILNKEKATYGYMYQNEYYLDNKLVKKSQEHNNILYYLKLDQQNSLKRKFKNLSKKGFGYDIVDDQLVIYFRGGSSLIYTGEDKDKFLNKILTFNKKNSTSK